MISPSSATFANSICKTLEMSSVHFCSSAVSSRPAMSCDSHQYMTPLEGSGYQRTCEFFRDRFISAIRSFSSSIAFST